MPSAEIIAPRLTQAVRVVGRAGATLHDPAIQGHHENADQRFDHRAGEGR